MTRLNLLPWREMRRKELDRQLLTIGVGAAILMLGVTFLAHLHVGQMVENQNARNTFLEGEIKKVEEEIKEIKELKSQRDALLARMRVIEDLQGDRTRIVHVFDDLARKMPEGAYLTNLTQSGTSFALKGVAQSNARVSALMRNLDASEWLATPDLDVINVEAKGSDRLSKFSLRVSQEIKADEDKPVAKPVKPLRGKPADKAKADAGAKS
jgi:type IV pilus assembly protein PilN